MDALENDYPSVLLAVHAPPCLSLYQPTHRHHPESQQDSIRFRNLVKGIETSLRQKYATRDTRPLLAPFHALADNREFWNHTFDGLAVLATSEMFKVYRLQRSVAELGVVADSFHIKPLIRILQSADRYQILGLTRRNVRLYEGNRDVVDEIDLASEIPRTSDDALARDPDAPERRNRVYGPALPGATTSHGTAVKEDGLASDTERFFRTIDRAVLEHHSRPTGMPLLLAALPEHHHLFRAMSRNPFLAGEAIDTNPDALSLDALRERAWQLMLPHYLRRLGGLIERFGSAKPNGLGEEDLAQIAAAAAAGRVATVLIEADREIPGHFDPATGAITFDGLDSPETDDLLDDIGVCVLKTAGEVVIVPAERMPTQTGIAAIYRY